MHVLLLRLLTELIIRVVLVNTYYNIIFVVIVAVHAGRAIRIIVVRVVMQVTGGGAVFRYDCGSRWIAGLVVSLCGSGRREAAE
jgi:hypothetical protein